MIEKPIAPSARRSLAWTIVATVLALPALASFGAHLIEHVHPLGFTRGEASHGAAIYVSTLLLHFGRASFYTTGLATVVAAAGVAQRRVSWWAKGIMVLLACASWMAASGIASVLQSCFGEAPHVP